MSDLLEKNRKRGPGGAPTRATSLPSEASERKNYPIASGVLDYFPDALVALSEISKAGNDQHNPGLPLRWTRSKSGDESDTCMRHFLQRGTLDTDGKRHTAKAAWRMLALLQKEIEEDQDKKLEKPLYEDKRIYMSAEELTETGRCLCLNCRDERIKNSKILTNQDVPDNIENS